MYHHVQGSGQGHINHFNFSPARNLGTSKNIKLFNTGNPANLLYTVWKNSKSKNAKNKNPDPFFQQNFTIIESQHELLARQLILLSIAFDKNFLSPKEKTFTYLEVYGNTLIRSVTVERLDKIINDLIKAICDEEYSQKRFKIFDFSKFKQKDRDALEKIFSLFRSKDARKNMAPRKNKINLDIEKMFDTRVRSYLGERYDHCQGAFDYDLSMNLHLEQNCKTVTKTEFQRFRKTGVSFTNHIDGDFKQPNRTLISGKIFQANLSSKTDKSYRSGYWGDIITGPFVTFGVETENEELLKTGNNLPMFSSETISEYNLNALFFEIENPGKVFVDPVFSVTNGKKKGVSEEPKITEIIEEEEDIQEVPQDEEEKLQDLPLKITFITTDTYKNKILSFKDRFNYLCEIKDQNLLYFSCVFEKDIIDTFKVDSTCDEMILESPRFLLDVAKKDFNRNWLKYFVEKFEGEFKFVEGYDKKGRLVKFVRV